MEEPITTPSSNTSPGVENDPTRPLLLDWLLTRLRMDPAVLDDPAIQAQLGPMWRRVPAKYQPYGRLMFAVWGGRFIWFTLGLQVLMGIGLLYLVGRIALPQLHGWWPAAVPVMLGLGVLAGFAVSRRVEVAWSRAGGSFSFPSLWRAMLFLIPIFILRAALIVLINRGVTDLLPLRNLLFFFVPGMLTTRASALIIRLRRLQREFDSTAKPILSP
jgi:hypothetical protein